MLKIKFLLALLGCPRATFSSFSTFFTYFLAVPLGNRPVRGEGPDMASTEFGYFRVINSVCLPWEIDAVVTELAVLILSANSSISPPTGFHIDHARQTLDPNIKDQSHLIIFLSSVKHACCSLCPRW